MPDTGLLTPVAIARIDHTILDQNQLAGYRFADETSFLTDSRQHFKGVILL